MKIYQRENFIVEAPELPHVTRTDEGHIKVSPKVKVVNRTQLAPRLRNGVMPAIFSPQRNTGFYDNFKPLN